MKKLFLILILSFSSFCGRASENCQSLWANGFPDARYNRVPLECERYLPSNVRLPRDLKVYIDNNLDTSIDAKAKAEVISEAANRAFRVYKSAWQAPKITLILYHRFFNDGTGENTLTWGFTFPLFNGSNEACPIIIYPSALLGLDNEELKQMVAHEVFHCFSYKEYPQQIKAAIKDERNHWHFEGLAQFFSNLVYPTINWEYYGVFPPYRGDVQLVRNSPYRAAHFFQSYHQYVGQNTGILFNFLQALPQRIGTNPLEVFNLLPEVDKAFHRFAEEAISDDLKDTDTTKGHPFGVFDVQHYELSDDSVQEFDIRYRTVSVFPYQIKLKKGHKYSFNLVDLEAGSRASYRFVEDGPSFSEFPGTVAVQCDEDKTLEIIATSTSTDEGLKRAKIILNQTKNENCKECQITDEPIDSCLVGIWKVDTQSYIDMKRRALPLFSTSLTGVSGDYYLFFDETKRNQIYYSDFNVDYAGVIQGMPVTMNHNYTGEANLSVQATNGKGCAVSLNSNIQVKQTITTPYGTPVSVFPHKPEAPGIEFLYKCVGDELKFLYSQDTSGNSSIVYELLFRRAVR